MVEIAERGMHGVIPIVGLLRCQRDQNSCHKAETEKRRSCPHEMFGSNGESSPITRSQTADSIFVNLNRLRIILASQLRPSAKKASTSIRSTYNCSGKKTFLIQRADARTARYFSNTHDSSPYGPEKNRLFPAPYRKDQQKDQLLRIG